MEETSFTSHKDNRMRERNGYCNQNAKMGIKVLSLFFLRPLESSHVPGCHFTILWIFRMGKSHEYWEKTTAHSQELSSSLLEFTHKLQVHTRNLKITLLLEFKGSKLKISQASLQWYWKCRFFFFLHQQKPGELGREGNEVQESICSVISWAEAVTAILQVSKCLARVV